MTGRRRGTVVVLSAVALTLMLLDLRGGLLTSSVRSVAAALLAPAQTVAGAIASPVVGWIEGTGSFADAQERARLWAEQAPAAVEVRNDQRIAELDGLLGAVNATKLTVIPARVVAYPLNTLAVDRVVIDAGSQDGVAADRAVVTGAGLVGRTVQVSPGTSEVKMLSAPDSAVGGRFLRTGQACAVLGTGDPGVLTVRVLDPVADVQVGDAVISFGSKDSRPFPADLPIGVVSAIDDDGAGGRIIRLEPAADLSALDLVGVVNTDSDRQQRVPLEAQSGPGTDDPSQAQGANGGVR